VGVGVFFGCSPFIGLQTVFALALAYLFKLNRVAVFLGLQVSLGPLTALAFFADAQLGEWLLYRTWLPMTVEGISALKWDQMGPRLVGDLALGGAVLGGTLGTLAGILTTWIVRRRRQVPEASSAPPTV
jgi:uncharacterized protein